jgi:alpha-1,3-rhamnosyl/mannosyltransferase
MEKVGINLLWLVPGVVGGSETYTTRLLHGLVERSSELDYTLFALPEFADAHPELAKSFKITFAPVSGHWKSFRVAGENSWLAAQCRRRHIDLIHHAGGTVPVVRVARSVLTVHDLQYLYYPEYFTKAKLGYLKTMVPRSAEAARLVLTPSEYTRRTVIERLNIDPSIVVVVPHGISPRPPQAASDVRARYGSKAGSSSIRLSRTHTRTTSCSSKRSRACSSTILTPCWSLPGPRARWKCASPRRSPS